MSEIITDLADLLFPHHPSRFEQAILEGKRLHLSTDRARAFQALLPWSKVGELATLERVLAGRTRITVNGHDLPLEMFTRIDWDRRRREIVPDMLQELAGKGVSMIINGIDQVVPRIAATAAMLQRHLEIEVGVNAYVTFRKASAFRAHWDGHNVLLLQLYGRKNWKFFGRHEVLPVTGHELDNSDHLGEPECEAMLQPGDILYLPRGEIHSGSVIDEHSLHLTVQIGPAQGIDFARWLAERATGTEALRRDILTLPRSPPLDEQLAELRAALHSLVDSADLEAFLADRGRRTTPYRPVNLGLDAPPDPQAWIKPTLRRCVALPSEGGKLEIGDVSVELSAAECAVLDTLLKRHALQFGALCGLFPGLSSDVVTESVAKLARKSLIFVLD